ncbi:hypothetical protein [Streptomyces sp. NPDC058622]|uniref:hypothetical protein n=1 Tax=Streptomyces sp. NPDC058622 TaxID=3346562 RepID=UPI0036556E66
MQIQDWDDKAYRANDNGTLPPVGFHYYKCSVTGTGASQEQIDAGHQKYSHDQVGTRISYLVAARSEPAGRQQNFHFMRWDREDKYTFEIRMIGGPFDGKYLGRSPDGYLSHYAESGAQWFDVGVDDDPRTENKGGVEIWGRDRGQQLRTYSFTKYATENQWWTYLTNYGAGQPTRFRLNIRHVNVPKNAKAADYSLR